MIKKAIIIGGGICGLTTAIALKSIDIEVEVFERAEALREVGAGLTLWANSIYSLKKLGLDEAVIESGARAQDFSFFDPAGLCLGSYDLDRVESTMGVPSISIHRQSLIEALKRFCDPVNLDHEFIDYDTTSSGVIAKFRNGNEVEGDIILGCDGFHSACRKKVLDDKIRYAGYTCWRGVLDRGNLDLDPGIIFHTCGNGSQFGILDIGRNKLAWYGTANEKKGTGYSTKEMKDLVLKVFSSWWGEIPSIVENTPGQSFLQNDISDRKPTAKWFADRILLMGDAAHPTTPNLGQGACQAIEDAEVLIECMKENSHPEEIFNTFIKKRYKRTRYVVDSSRYSGWLNQTESKIIESARDYYLRTSFAGGSSPMVDRIICHKNDAFKIDNF